MAVIRDRPYVQFNFLVDIGDGQTEGRAAGFQEVRHMEKKWPSRISERQSQGKFGDEVTGMNKSTDVTMKRGVIGSLNLYQWLDHIRNGDQNACARSRSRCRTRTTPRS